MLDIALIRDNPEWVKERLSKLYVEPEVLERIDKIHALDIKRRELRTEVETLQSKRKILNKQMGALRGNKALDQADKNKLAFHASQAIEQHDFDLAEQLMGGDLSLVKSNTTDEAAFDLLIEALKKSGNYIDEGFRQIKEVETELEESMLWIPNLPHPSVPVFESEDSNIPQPEKGAEINFEFSPKAHWDLGDALGIIDQERGVKLSGSRFYILRGWGARLQRALSNYFLDIARENGFEEVYLPFLVKEEMLFGSAQFPKFRDVVYEDSDAGLYLLPTAEVAITNMHRDEVLDEDQLPLYYVGHTPCFRRERASAGKDTRGIKRVHQFQKVEMFIFANPENSYAELEKLTGFAESLCEKLGLRYRRLEIVTGDLGFSATKKYDVEVWAPGAEEWLEVSSCSNTEAFQARRALLRYRPANGKSTEYVHTLNGSGLALPRIIAAILETYQQADGSIIIPEVLRSYLGADKIEAIQ
ncbi:serine--tRNA ligase [Anaerolineales bacterium]